MTCPKCDPIYPGVTIGDDPEHGAVFERCECETMTDPKPLTKTELKRTASARAKQLLREMGVVWSWCEADNVRGKVRWKTDLFGLFDVVYFEQGRGTAPIVRLVGVQVTQHNGSARVAKMLGKQQPHEDPEKGEYRRRALWAWLRSGARAEVWDWRERKQGGAVVAVERVVMPLEMADLATDADGDSGKAQKPITEQL